MPLHQSRTSASHCQSTITLREKFQPDPLQPSKKSAYGAGNHYSPPPQSYRFPCTEPPLYSSYQYPRLAYNALHPSLSSLFFSFPNSPEPTMIIQHIIEILIDRKSTRLNSSHVSISYAVFCLKKKI